MASLSNKRRDGDCSRERSPLVQPPGHGGNVNDTVKIVFIIILTMVLVLTVGWDIISVRQFGG